MDIDKLIERYLVEGELSTKERKLLKKGSFAIPSKAPGPGSYPIPDIAHARNALARVAQHGTPEEQAQVRAAEYRKFPELKKNKADEAQDFTKLSSKEKKGLG